jgi:predicted GTPase
MRRVVAIVDGEHYPPVVKDALEEIDDLVVAAVLVGGTEKLRGGDPAYGVPLEPSLEDAIERHLPDLVLDLSDEPEVVFVRPTVEALLDMSRDGRHAASDHLETAEEKSIEKSLKKIM